MEPVSENLKAARDTILDGFEVAFPNADEIYLAYGHLVKALNEIPIELRIPVQMLFNETGEVGISNAIDPDQKINLEDLKLRIDERRRQLTKMNTRLAKAKLTGGAESGHN